VKAAVLGVGGLGRIIALELASDPGVEELVLGDVRGDRSKALRSIGRTAAVRPLQLDVGNPVALREALIGVDVAVNATLPEHNLTVMAACLEVGCAYVDPWGLSPVAPGERPGVLDQLDLDEAWRKRGLTAVVTMGSDPGISNIMARAAADRLATIEEIRILKAAAGGGLIEGYPLYSRAVFLRDAVSPPTVWEDGRLVAQPFVSGEEDYEFPAPVGKRHVYNFYHEEVLTLSHRLGRPVGRVCYKHDINPDLVRAVVALDALGLLGEDKRLPLGGGRMTFRDALLATFPEPSTLIGPVEGAMAIVAEVLGTKADGTRARMTGSIVIDHHEANRKRGTTAELYLTAAAVASAATLLVERKALRPGVLAPEELPADVLLPDLAARGVTFQVTESRP
jgi:saccharopine dehydrogenase-like NADP-dependent oxidoreductase